MFVRLAIALAVGASLAGCATSGSSQYHGGVSYGYGRGPAYYDTGPYYDRYSDGYGYGDYGYGPIYFGFSSIGIESFGGYCSVQYRACLPWWFGSAYDPYWRFGYGYGYAYGYGGYWGYPGWGGSWGWPGHGHGHHHDHEHGGEHDGHDHDGDHDHDHDHDQGQAGNDNDNEDDGDSIFRPRPQREPRMPHERRDVGEIVDNVFPGHRPIGESQAAMPANPGRERADWRHWQGPRDDRYDREPKAYPRQRDPAMAEPRPFQAPPPWREDEATPGARPQRPSQPRPAYRPEPRSQAPRPEPRRFDPPARSSGESRGGNRRPSRSDDD